MSVCIFGNSHLAALKLASDNFAHDGKLVFWGAPAPLISQVWIENGILHPPEESKANFLQVSGGLERVDPKEFDTIVFHAFTLYFHQAAFRLGAMGALSAAFMKSAAGDWLRASRAFQFAKQMRERSETEIIFSPAPCPSEASREVNPREEVSADQCANLIEILDALVVAEGFRLLRQPDITLSAHTGYTKTEYAVGSVRLSSSMTVAHPPDDYDHMNASYGREVLGALYGMLAKAPRVSVRES